MRFTLVSTEMPNMTETIREMRRERGGAAPVRRHDFAATLRRFRTEVRSRLFGHCFAEVIQDGR
jgi:hypothetical protein